MSYASVKFLANIFVVATYGMVGWYLADRQVRRYLTSDVWSLSGVSLTGVFFTCAQMHLIDATTDGFPLHRHNVFFSSDYAAEFDAIVTRRRLPDEPTVYVCAQDRGDELKLVYPQPLAAPERFESLAFTHFFLQPMDGPSRAANTEAAIAYCLQHPQWRLSLQTHKLIGLK
mgnify:CR=1 FL=1